MADIIQAENSIKFLGTAGARFVMIKQLRSSGGTWLCLAGKNILLDPGPGSLVRATSSKPKLDPTKLDAIIITHKHLDHTGDLSVMIEAMTEGGFKKRGLLFGPGDALEDGKDPILLKYLRGFPEKTEIFKEGGEYRIGDVSFSTPVRHIHGVETYGLNFRVGGNDILSVITDTKYFEGIEKYYPGKVLIINVVRFEVDPSLDHLSIPEAKRIIEKAKPQKAVITHFGMKVVQAKPWEVAEAMTKELGIEVIAARDGMELSL
ncbi:hypothetical protein COY52_02155 [Candidatus Desantisbacteria bacterium CG_4_10_14_0_8_um_filter_48_22]|uniref:Metallo-beta-lactamase domain-containing protein n=1 Tax=Candidatus Desantisbacteria bacterium CG_4_10_14_0_8_um_filter_48_22 TaxID=1974543 RepID=A0A2M7SEG8_9BACT|nr:MAG: hypothetical protein AUJ67_09505 [Candidatus Desantisbacteria bacterium CG1_02_49_89]PIV55056.1 MAG: hypothetical protein COS16_08520 [Candidatus Desantisbacteria bacterium CG02_land_8_20_14_3_00_49_13]PIZ17922.1 MAG: hypothetical protein COY52_02155 [Candidatus Desantisbacteria bacterium CG_4_10_14_0_8_um_filter_48_22]PJB28946.1 MAG: hypothetical protein CO111_00245 [Candidatus Desantisbacteria bacterium CG_4_9_14_3_um_filter_50_7]